MKSRVFSGIQPSGVITLGNYLGALNHFVALQDTHESFYCVVNLHALTLPKNQDPTVLRARTLDLAALYLACGLDPKRATLFIQGDVPAHAELGWIMQCVVHMGELSRMTQYKEKSDGKDAVLAGLFTYPALMAADILLYDTALVPVGDDQKQHIELTRDLAMRFNHRFGDTFVIPDILLMKEGARIMSLDDPTKKMSKSNPLPGSRIEMLDTPDEIRKKISRAVTDSGREVRYDPSEKAAVSNLLAIFSLITNTPIAQLVDQYEGQGYGPFKRDLAEAIVTHLEPIQERFSHIRSSDEINAILAEGAARADAVATKTLARVKDALGLSLR
ncbi:tryptophan--tRNA ligase [Ferroacidibacillus organovorans]|uniref:Tryptophan--tRNA ligase n=1 Tax=Ferroacidibacillus organovorans TaxID=1765683 RepID=A0A101XR46_9BACL|nr:tryptophan--tRNA ligase [Ferroacidibacillus organovorans]KUO96007.1 tryptophan--tRNA ligase [Ferroacidibacillus organovorans]